VNELARDCTFFLLIFAGIGVTGFYAGMQWERRKTLWTIRRDRARSKRQKQTVSRESFIDGFSKGRASVVFGIPPQVFEDPNGLYIEEPETHLFSPARTSKT
jgi:hypothetical protein